MAKRKPDFEGWATKNDLLCSDGRTIRKDAFAHMDGAEVPLVWMHQHDDPMYVLGHAQLSNREEGVWTKGFFNETERGKVARELVHNGDIVGMSIWANHLKQNGGDVLHGDIKEVSLVLARANPGALIEFPVIAHGDELEEEAKIFTGEALTISHADDEDEEKKPEDPKEDKKVAEKDTKERTVGDVLNEFTEEQKKVVYYLIGQAVEDAKKGSGEEDDEMKHSDNDEGDDVMRTNVFDRETAPASAVLSHDDMQQIFADAKRLGSLKDSVLQHMEDNDVLAHAFGDVPGVGGTDYGIANIDYLFPEAKTINNGAPEFLRRPDSWVSVVMNGVHHTGFSRVKSIFANITADEARARGFTKGKKKIEEVFTLLKRKTTPQTVYKKQKLDRDDILDITDFSVVAWIKGEMRLQLDEELARAYLIGDGRSSAADDKIHEDNIRPIATDDGLYTISATVTAGADEEATAKNFIKAAIRARKNYKGSGNPILFTTEDVLTSMLMLTDDIGRDLYPTEASLATKLRVSRIVTVPVMEGYNVSGKGNLMGLIVNLNDYNVGADKGGQVSMFEDFDIDYNQEKYLIETRCSGALVKPFSAIALWTAATNIGPTYETVSPVGTEDPSAEGWYEKSALNNYFLSSDTEVDSDKTYYTKA